MELGKCSQRSNAGQVLEPFQASTDEVRVTVQSDATLARVKEALAKALDRPRGIVEAHLNRQGAPYHWFSSYHSKRASEQQYPSCSGSQRRPDLLSTGRFVQRVGPTAFATLQACDAQSVWDWGEGHWLATT